MTVSRLLFIGIVAHIAVIPFLVNGAATKKVTCYECEGPKCSDSQTCQGQSCSYQKLSDGREFRNCITGSKNLETCFKQSDYETYMCTSDYCNAPSCEEYNAKPATNGALSVSKRDGHWYAVVFAGAVIFAMTVMINPLH